MPASAKPSLWLSLVLTGTLLLGVVGGVYLVNHPQIFKSKASENGSVIILDTNGQQLENNTTTTPNIKLNIELPDWNSNPPQSFNLNFSLVKEAKAYHGSCLDTYNDCIYWEGYICDDNTHSCILPSQPALPAINNICEYEESAGLEVCQYGGRRICKGTDEGEGCHYNENVVPACRDICKCQYEEDVQNCSYGGKRVCWGEEEISRGKSCGYSYVVEPLCEETCNASPQVPAPEEVFQPQGVSDWEGGCCSLDQQCGYNQTCSDTNPNCQSGIACKDIQASGISTPDIPEVTERVRISLDSSAIQPNGSCQDSSDPYFNGNSSSHCLEMTYPQFLSKSSSGGLAWFLPAPGEYILYAGFISNKGNFRQTQTEPIIYQTTQSTASTTATQTSLECGCTLEQNTCNAGCTSRGTVGDYCTEDSTCTTRIEFPIPQYTGQRDELYKNSGLSLEDYQKILTDLQAVYGDKVIGWVWQDLGLGEKRPTPIFYDTEAPGGGDLSLQGAVDVAGYIQTGAGITGAVVGNSANKILQTFGNVLKTLVTNTGQAVFYAGSYILLNPDDSGESILTITQAESLLGEKIELLYVNYGEEGLVPRGVIKTASLEKRLEDLGGLDIEYFPDKDLETGEERVAIYPKSEVSVYQRASEVFFYSLVSEAGGRAIVGVGSGILSRVSGPIRNLFYTKVVGSNIPDGVLTTGAREVVERGLSSEGRGLASGFKVSALTIEQRLETQAILRQKYGLPQYELSTQDPAEYIRRLLQIADENGIDVRQSGEYGTRLFDETGVKGGVYQTDFVQIILNNPNRSISESIQNLEHEVIHGLQFKRYPRMPIDEKEFESYLASSAPGDILSSPGRIDNLIEDSLKVNQTLDNAVAGGIGATHNSLSNISQARKGKMTIYEAQALKGGWITDLSRETKPVVDIEHAIAVDIVDLHELPVGAEVYMNGGHPSAKYTIKKIDDAHIKIWQNGGYQEAFIGIPDDLNTLDMQYMVNNSDPADMYRGVLIKNGTSNANTVNTMPYFSDKGYTGEGWYDSVQELYVKFAQLAQRVAVFAPTTLDIKSANSIDELFVSLRLQGESSESLEDELMKAINGSDISLSKLPPELREQVERFRVVKLPQFERTIPPKIAETISNSSGRGKLILSETRPGQFFTEEQALKDMERFFDELETNAPLLRSDVRLIKQNAIFLGEPEVSQSITAMTQRLERYSQLKTVIVFKKDPNLSSSDTYITTRIMKQFEGLVRGDNIYRKKVYVSSSPSEVARLAKEIGYENIKIMVFDDIVLSGEQMALALVGHFPLNTQVPMIRNPDSLGDFLMSISGFSKEQIKDVLEVNVFAISENHDLVTHVNDSLNINTYYIVSPYSIPKFYTDSRKGVSISSVYSSSDFGWDITIEDLIKEYKRITGKDIKTPILYKIQRPYKDGHPEVDSIYTDWHRIEKEFRTFE